MPYTHLELESHDWPFPNRYFDPAKASALYKTYVESMIHAEGCGFDWVGCNEHHFSPYGMMANCNLIGGAQYEPTEENPMLGFRGASRYVAPAFRDCFDLECEAMRKVREAPWIA